jgi:hypothetical protein
MTRKLFAVVALVVLGTVVASTANAQTYKVSGRLVDVEVRIDGQGCAPMYTPPTGDNLKAHLPSSGSEPDRYARYVCIEKGAKFGVHVRSRHPGFLFMVGMLWD